MDDNSEPASPPTRVFNEKLSSWLMVLLIIMFVVLIRGRLLNMPLERDEGEYAYAGQLILQGVPPYELAYNMKLPGTYYAYAAGMAIFGQTPVGIHLTLLVVNAVTIFFIFLLGRALFGNSAGLAAAATYAILSASPAVLGMAAHANHFVLLFAVPATLILWKARTPNRLSLIFLAGLLYGTAFVMKQQAIFFGLFGICILIWYKLRNESVSWRSLMNGGGVYGLGLILPFGFTCLLMWRDGVFQKFWFWTFTYARSYATATLLSDGIVNLATYLGTPLHLNVFLGFWLLAVIGLVLSSRDKSMENQVVFLIAFAFFSLCATATGLYFRKHYFILMLPALAVAVGMASRRLSQWLETRTTKSAARIIPAGLLAVVLAWNIFVQRDFFFRLSPAQAVQAAYAVEQEHFAESIPVARYIEAHSSTNDTIAVIGSEPQIYFYAHCHSATGYIYTYALMEAQPHAIAMQQEMEREIEAGRPEFLVDVGYDNSWIIRPASNLGIFHWFAEYAAKFYERVGIIESFSTGETHYLWGDDAKNYSGAPGQYMAIYKRKPAAATDGILR